MPEALAKCKGGRINKKQGLSTSDSPCFHKLKNYKIPSSAKLKYPSSVIIRWSKRLKSRS